MKGNFKLKVSILLLFFSFCCIKATWAQEKKCGNQISLKEVKSSLSDSNSGSITINVISSGKFESTLFRISGSGKQLIETQFGEGTTEVVFQNVESNNNLQILVTFLDEESGWCKRRQISGIKTLER